MFTEYERKLLTEALQKVRKPQVQERDRQELRTALAQLNNPPPVGLTEADMRDLARAIEEIRQRKAPQKPRETPQTPQRTELPSVPQKPVEQRKATAEVPESYYGYSVKQSNGVFSAYDRGKCIAMCATVERLKEKVKDYAMKGKK